MNLNCLPQNFSKLTLAVLFTIIGMGAVVVGLTVLPFIGLFLALPMFGLAFYFYRTHLTQQCEISES